MQKKINSTVKKKYKCWKQSHANAAEALVSTASLGLSFQGVSKRLCSRQKDIEHILISNEMSQARRFHFTPFQSINKWRICPSCPSVQNEVVASSIHIALCQLPIIYFPMGNSFLDACSAQVWLALLLNIYLQHSDPPPRIRSCNISSNLILPPGPNI